MTYAAHETSIEGGKPVEAYRFQVGATFYYYTSAMDNVTIGAQTYTALGIQRSNTADGPDVRDYDFQVTIPTANPVAQLFTSTLPGVRVRLTVFRFHRDDTPTPEVITVFDGYVNGARFEKQLKECVLAARPTISAIGRVIPPRTYQSKCNHTLYDPLTCRVDDTDPAFRASAKSVSAQVGNVLMVTGLGAYASGWFKGGFVEVVGAADYRQILQDDGAGNLRLLYPFATTPTTVNVFAGCAHRIDVCKSKFDNVINFGGFAFVPKKNPYNTGID